MGEAGIGELNESSLHSWLKAWYAADGGASEVPVGRYVVDAVLADGRVVEIQTGRLGKIRGKLAALLEHHPVRLAFPIAVEKHLLVYDAKGRDLLYRRRSPKLGSVLISYPVPQQRSDGGKQRLGEVDGAADAAQAEVHGREASGHGAGLAPWTAGAGELR